MVAAPRNFADLVGAHGLAFHAFGVDVEALARSETGRSWLGNSSHRPWQELRLLTALVHELATAMGSVTGYWPDQPHPGAPGRRVGGRRATEATPRPHRRRSPLRCVAW